MIIKADLLGEVVLLIDADLKVRDAFESRGPTEHHTQYPVTHYTYRSLLTLPGFCCVCGNGLDALQQPCTSSGGFHAFAGMTDDPHLPDAHKVENRSLDILALAYDELHFYIERDNLFPITQISEPMNV